MKIRNRIGLLLILTMVITGIGGCAMDSYERKEIEKEVIEKEKQVVLNKRQKDILESQGLTTEYDELSGSQQRAIVAIEEMLQAVESKYNMKFAYAGYIANSVLEEEQLIAYPVGTDKSLGTFTVTRVERDGEYEYTDTYISMAANDIFSSYVKDFLCNIYQINNVKVVTEITATSLEKVPNDFSELDGKAEGSVLIFIDGGSFAESQIEDLESAYENWLKEHRIYGATQIILLKEDVLPYITKYNYMDYLSTEYYIERVFHQMNK